MMINTTERSRILLLCLGLDSDKTEVKKVGVKELKELFGEFGPLTKVIIFTRKVLLKAFLEYSGFECAEKAKIAYHEKFVKNYGKARLYFSPMQDLKYSNKYIEFWDDSMTEKPSNLDDDNSTQMSLKHSKSNGSARTPLRKDSLKFDVQPFNNQSGFQLFSKSTDKFGGSVFNNDYHLNYKPMDNQICSANYIKEKTGTSQFNGLDNSAITMKPDYHIDQPVKLSKVVLVSNLANVFKNGEEIFNLFSAFGNITKILLMKNHQKALIEYTSIEYASESITNINNLKLGETILRINYSKYKTIDLQKNNQNENSMQFNEVLTIPPIKNRYRSSPQPSINPISSTLLVSFPKIGNLQTIDVYLFIEKFCRPIKTKLINNKSFIGKCEVVNMLFSFADVQSAVYVMYKCHNSIIKGALLDIFFF